MSPNEIITVAKKRIKNSGSAIDWNSLYAMIIDDIFTRKTWKFAQGELNYIHSQNLFEKQFNDDMVELSLSKIKSIRLTTSYTIGGGVPVPVPNTTRELDYEPLQRFMYLYPDQTIQGIPFVYTELFENDGTSGKKIGVYYLPSSDASVWVHGDFIPTYTINSAPMPILPIQFHRLVSYGLIMHAADEMGQDKLSAKAEKWFEMGIARMDIWDTRNGKYHMTKMSEEGPLPPRKGPFFPENYPFGIGR